LRIEKKSSIHAFVVLAAFGVCGICANARAQETDVLVRIEYNAPPDCPTQEAFVSEVRSRNPHIHRVSDDPKLRTFIITIAPDGGEIHGHLTIRETNGAQAARDVAGDTCAEVASALALITALSAGASASSSDAPAASSAASPIEPPKNVPPKPSATTAPIEAPIDAPKQLEPDPSASSEAKRWTFDVGVDAALVSGVSPDVLFALPIFFEARAPAHGLFAPALRAASGEIDFGGPTARFAWTTGALEGCPIRLSSGTLSLEPCLRAEVGILEGEGSNVSPPRNAAGPWVALGATARARWLFASPFFFDFGGGFRAPPLVQSNYFFEPNTRIYQPSSVGWSGSAGFGVRFL
jgi:hypothetical protein